MAAVLHSVALDRDELRVADAVLYVCVYACVCVRAASDGSLLSSCAHYRPAIVL